MKKADRIIAGKLVDSETIMSSPIKSNSNTNRSTVNVHGTLDEMMAPVQTASPSKTTSNVGKLSGNGAAASSGFPAARPVKHIDNISKIGLQKIKK